MNFQHKSQKILIVGDSGSGKSTFWLNYLTKSDHKLKLIFDSEGEYTMRGRTGILCRNARELQQTAEQILAGEVKTKVAIYDPSVEFAGATEQGFEWFCNWAFEVGRIVPMIPKIVATDELQNLIGTDIISESFRKVLETGRRYGIDFAAVTQALNLIHNRVRNQITELVVFHTAEENALKYLKSRGFDYEEVSTLPTLKFVARDLRTNRESRGKLYPWKTHDRIDTESPDGIDTFQLADILSPGWGDEVGPVSQNM